MHNYLRKRGVESGRDGALQQSRADPVGRAGGEMQHEKDQAYHYGLIGPLISICLDDGDFTEA